MHIFFVELFGRRMISLYILAGQVLEVVLAKPQAERKFDAANPHNAQVPNYIPHPGYGGMPVNPYASIATGYGGAAGFQQVVAVLFLFGFYSFL